MLIDPTDEKADNFMYIKYLLSGSRLLLNRLPENIQFIEESLHTHESTGIIVACGRT